MLRLGQRTRARSRASLVAGRNADELAAGPPTIPTPLSIFGADLDFWWHSDPANVTLDGSNLVAAIADVSGKGHHATQATPAKRPAWLTNRINGRAALRLTTDVDQSLAWTGFNQAPSQTVYVVAKHYDLSAGYAAGLVSANSSGIACYLGIDSVFQAAVRINDGPFHAKSPAHTSNVWRPYMWGWEVAGADAFYTWRAGGTLVTATPGTSATYGLWDKLGHFFTPPVEVSEIVIAKRWRTELEHAAMLEHIAEFYAL